MWTLWFGFNGINETFATVFFLCVEPDDEFYHVYIHKKRKKEKKNKTKQKQNKNE